MKQHKATFYDVETDGDVSITMFARRKTILDVAEELQEIIGVDGEITIEEIPQVKRERLVNTAYPDRDMANCCAIEDQLACINTKGKVVKEGQTPRFQIQMRSKSWIYRPYGWGETYGTHGTFSQAVLEIESRVEADRIVPTTVEVL